MMRLFKVGSYSGAVELFRNELFKRTTAEEGESPKIEPKFAMVLFHVYYNTVQLLPTKGPKRKEWGDRLIALGERYRALTPESLEILKQERARIENPRPLGTV